jgi:hypothetical protein
MLNCRRAAGVEGGSLFKPENAVSYKNYPLSLRLFYKKVAIKLKPHITLIRVYKNHKNKNVIKNKE